MKENIVGKRYGIVLIVEELQPAKTKQRVVRFLCNCGKESNTLLLNLVSGNTKSCGCLRKKTTSNRFKTHGLSKTGIYRIFHGMKNRCFNRNNQSYCDYGGRGISICQEWLDDFLLFHSFCLENGWKPGLEIDRINNDGWYQPDNCRFIPGVDNNRNRRILFKSNTSGYRGVSKIGPSYKVTVMHNGISFQKRGFKTAEEAARYRDDYCRSMGIDTKLNFFQVNEI
jgi:hypothetical protein